MQSDWRKEFAYCRQHYLPFYDSKTLKEHIQNHCDPKSVLDLQSFQEEILNIFKKYKQNADLVKVKIENAKNILEKLNQVLNYPQKFDNLNKFLDEIGNEYLNIQLLKDGIIKQTNDEKMSEKTDINWNLISNIYLNSSPQYSFSQTLKNKFIETNNCIAERHALEDVPLALIEPIITSKECLKIKCLSNVTDMAIGIANRLVVEQTYPKLQNYIFK